MSSGPLKYKKLLTFFLFIQLYLRITSEKMTIEIGFNVTHIMVIADAQSDPKKIYLSVVKNVYKRD